jgi:hypothetical protein
VDVAVAGGADHEGFASPVGHGLGPLGLKRPGLTEVGELADVVDFHLAGLLQTSQVLSEYT